MVSGSMTSFQQWSSKSRAMVCSCVTISIPFLLLHPHVLIEIIIRGMVAFVDLSAAQAVIARIEHALEKIELQHPGGFRLLPAIPAGHGIVEPPVRSTGVDLDRIALVVAIEAVAEAPHVGERNHMVGLAENAENRTLDRGNDVVERLGIARASLPFALRGRAIPDERRRERTLRRQHQRMASGLADALDSDFRCVDLRKLDELGNRRVEIGYGLRVGHVIADLAAVKRCLIRMLVEEIRRDADVTVAGKALGQIPRVVHKAIALVHEHDSRCFGSRRGNGKEGGEFSSAAHGFGGDTGHRGHKTMLGLRRLRSQSIRLTWRTWICQRSARCTKRWPHQPERNRVPSTRNSLIRKFERTMRAAFARAANTSTFEIIRTVRDFGACDQA